MITLHHLESSRSHCILWLFEERYKRDPNTTLAPPELLEVHPLGKAPVISDDGTTIAESGAIIEYMVDRYGKAALIAAPGTPDRTRYTYWMDFAEGTAARAPRRCRTSSTSSSASTSGRPSSAHSRRAGRSRS